jgi:hypothetical protein
MFGLVHCPSCNPDHLPAQDIAAEIQCAWCFNQDDGIHYRYVKVETYKRWRFEHNLPEEEDEIETSPQTRSALAHPPPLPHADTEPAPPFRKPNKREEEE